MTYKPGDWVVLGSGGRGWAPDKKGSIVQIADIGPHLVGTLYDKKAYDFYVHPNTIITKAEQITKSGSNGGGWSSNISRLAAPEEVYKLYGVRLAPQISLDFIFSL